jgi:hypothetical protein|tara:strand:+ start:263 stop:478 length:216 start_codon:yes stop_codon:yes gene_type:complete
VEEEHNEFHPDLDWACTMTMGIDEIRALYDHFSYALETWPGHPRRPLDEQEFLRVMKMRMFAMLCDYQMNE